MSEREESVHKIGGFLEEGRGKKGWFVGSWMSEELNQNENVEIAVKKLRPGDKEGAHRHTQSTEICMVMKGVWPVTIDGEDVILKAGDYILSAPGSILEWEIPEGSKPVRVVVVRTPSINDKVAVTREDLNQ